MRRIDGKKIASEVLAELKKLGVPEKILAIVVPGSQKDASRGFVLGIQAFASALGVATRIYYKVAGVTTEGLVDDIEKLAAEECIGGITVVLPLPNDVDQEKVLAAISTNKDIDCLNPATQLVIAPAVLVVERFLATCRPNRDPSCFYIAIVGMGTLIGRPLHDHFVRRGYWVGSFNSKSVHVLQLVEADLVISGTGVPGRVRPSILKPGADLIDFGYPGDVDESDPGLAKVGYYIPSKGGTGPILVACMFENFYRLTGLLK